MNQTNISGTITLDTGEEIAINDDNICQGTFYIVKSIEQDGDIKIGSANIGEMGMTVIDGKRERSAYSEAVITLFYTADEDGVTGEPEPLGVFNVCETKRLTQDTIEIKAYDNMAKLDADFILPDEWHMQKFEFEPYNVLSYFCSQLGLGIGTTPKAIANMPNGTKKIGFIYGASFNSDISTFRDMFSLIAELLCGYVYADGKGKICIGSFVKEASKTITEDYRKNTYISDFVKRVDGVRLDISPVGTTSREPVSIVKPDGASGTILQLNDGPFYRFTDVSVIEDYVTEIAEAITQLAYVPTETDLFSEPSVSPGDMLTYTGNTAGDGVPTLITSIDWTYRGAYKVISAGSETQQTVKPMSSRQTQQLSNMVAESTAKVFSYTPDIVYIIPKRQELLTVEFTVTSYTADLNFSGQLVFDMKESGTVYAEYELDGVTLAEKVKQHARVGMNTLNLFLPLKESVGKHTLKVFVYCDIGYGISREVG